MNVEKGSIILPLPTEEIVNNEENMWRVKLPAKYKSFLIENNGGVPVEKSFMANNHSYAIDRFLCVLEDTENNDLGEYDIDVTLTRIEERLTDNEDLVGVDLLPIAILFAGDYLCLDYRESKDRPKVCVWNHEESGELDPVVYFVANSFEEFINSLE
ncbi:SMI1/KNR4 family protein [Listeria booriae]|uniref:SMI1/KNR4 family protein n=1 Tax=Listeria booriae TaxID=1552123 RepID=A0A7X1A415_9LIST|nr:SMI1/KNR4 family protein [Listeria booriae]MBC1227224.1 SMI1/KNR4 family protein [Listeria booriae]MBC1492376.1 SMI1/KNR4 family protein [Listeria booriae]MBC1504241.1 SMI1/KNR4 family protein [Listeria booriae]MBC2370892.1 SMI1/KNR4 family protein [Listeria booriae]MBC6135993.1 SMI1/KNR4 family protein [Listeria booriae]